MTRSPALRRTATAGVVVVLLLGAASCSSGDPEPKREIDASTFMPVVISTLRAEGSADMSFDVDAGPDSMVVDGVVEFRADGETDGRFRTEASGMKFDMLVADDRLWIAYDELTAGQFFEVDVRHGTPTEREFAGMVDQLDPLRSFEPFADAVESVRVLGKPKSFGGVKTRLHRVVVDTSLIHGLPELEELPPEAVPPYIVYEMYLDAEGLLRHVDFRLGPVSMKVDYSRFGAKQRVDPPEPHEITRENPFIGLDLPI